MKAEKLAEHFGMQPHEENGTFIERHYPSNEPRPASGSIYYYLSPDEKSVFHQLEFDEYWVYNAGETLDIWVFEEDGSHRILRCGTDEDAEPLAFFPKGCIFAARHRNKVEEGTFVTCITVPRFDYSGSTLISEEEMLRRFPESEEFFK